MPKDFSSLKEQTIKMSDAEDVRSTDILDGEAKDSPVMNESNKTEQYRTGSLEVGDLGGKNNPKG